MKLNVRLKLLGSLTVLAFLLGACALTPPVSVSYRESIAGQGMILSVTNTSAEYLHEVTVRIKSPEGEVKEHYMVTLRPHESVNVGWLKLDGWPIPEGSEVTVSCKGYALDSGPWKVAPP